MCRTLIDSFYIDDFYFYVFYLVFIYICFFLVFGRSSIYTRHFVWVHMGVWSNVFCILFYNNIYY